MPVKPKARIFTLSTRVPLVRETADPWIFLVLLALVVVATAGVILAGDVFPGDKDARTHVIQVATGLLVILGAYFTAVNIREVRAQRSFEQLCAVIDQLGSQSESVRVGAIRLLQSLAHEELDLPGGALGRVVETRRLAILDALAVVAGEHPATPCADLANEVLEDLESA